MPIPDFQNLMLPLLQLAAGRAEHRLSDAIEALAAQQLAQYLIDYDIGVAEVSRYVVKKLDLDYFEEE